MDKYDMEIQGMLKHRHNYYTEPLNEDNLEKITSFVEKYEGKEVLLIRSVLNERIKIFGADIRLTGSSKLYMKNSVIYVSSFDNFSLRLYQILNRHTTPYHDKDYFGGYFYMFKDGLLVEVVKAGKIIKRYDLEVF